jgi:hypothetical protein
MLRRLFVILLLLSSGANAADKQEEFDVSCAAQRALDDGQLKSCIDFYVSKMR